MGFVLVFTHAENRPRYNYYISKYYISKLTRGYTESIMFYRQSTQCPKRFKRLGGVTLITS